MPKKLNQIGLDANESLFFARELESIKARSYDIMYPEYKAVRLIPVSTEAGPGAESITYEQYDRVGQMKLIANYSDNLPASDVYGKEFTSKVRSLGGSFSYSLQEIRAANMAGKPLQQRKANSARQSYEQEVNTIGWFADGSSSYEGLYGLLYNPNITSGSATNGSWGSATPNQIIEDVNDLINGIRTLTKGAEEPDTVLLPTAKYSQIASTPRSDNSDTTILEFLQRVHPTVTFEWVNELASLAPLPSGGSGPADVMIAYRNSPDKLTLELPQPYEMLPEQPNNLSYKVPTHARVGGVIVYYPLSISVAEGI